MSSDTTSAIPSSHCRRCGTCCRKGGPALHLEDQPLVDSGKILLKHLLTFRQGEPVFDNVNETIAPAVTDIIKVKSAHENTSVCSFYDTAPKNCTIYGHRPIECRALKCWDTRKIESIYTCRRLTRRHLLSKVKGLWELVEDHQDRCDYAYVAELAHTIRQNRQAQASGGQLLELVRYDRHLRQVTLERANLDPGMLSFLFGRPLSFTIKLYQLELTRTDRGERIEPIDAPPIMC
jgi:Fe-S-cluster containining protein